MWGSTFYVTPVRGTGVDAVLAGQLLGGGASTSQVVLSTVPIVLLAGAAAMALTVVGRRQDG